MKPPPVTLSGNVPTVTDLDHEAIAAELEGKRAEDALTWMFETFEAAVKDLTLPAEFSLETMEQFIDWNRQSPYKVERGEGECAI